MACKPATPTPITNTLAGAIVPAAVIIIGKALPSTPAASIIALYPAKLLCEERISIDCARVMRGNNSMANAVTPCLASASMSGLLVIAPRLEIRMVPDFSSETSLRLSPLDGGRTFNTISAAPNTSAASAAI